MTKRFTPFVWNTTGIFSRIILQDKRVTCNFYSNLPCFEFPFCNFLKFFQFKNTSEGLIKLTLLLTERSFQQSSCVLIGHRKWSSSRNPHEFRLNFLSFLPPSLIYSCNRSKQFKCFNYHLNIHMQIFCLKHYSWKQKVVNFFRGIFEKYHLYVNLVLNNSQVICVYCVPLTRLILVRVKFLCRNFF